METVTEEANEALLIITMILDYIDFGRVQMGFTKKLRVPMSTETRTATFLGFTQCFASTKFALDKYCWPFDIVCIQFALENVKAFSRFARQMMWRIIFPEQLFPENHLESQNVLPDVVFSQGDIGRSVSRGKSENCFLSDLPAVVLHDNFQGYFRFSIPRAH